MPDRELADPATLIARAVLRLGRRLRAARPPDAVSLSTLALLTTLHRQGAMTGVALARQERLQPQSLTRMLAAMEAEGLIQRQRDEADQRALVIQITAKGRGVVGRDLAARRAWLDQAMDMALTLDEREQLAQAALLMLKLADDGSSSS